MAHGTGFKERGELAGEDKIAAVKIIEIFVCIPHELHFIGGRLYCPADITAQFSGSIECLLIQHREGGDEPVGFALFFPTYSTWLGRSGMWLEDLYITPSARKRGAGTLMLRHLARLCVERAYGRFEWNSRNFNHAATEFYVGLGARPVEETTTFRVAGEGLERLAAG